MGTDNSTPLAKRQAAALRAHDRMLSILIQYSPCGKLSVDDVLYIARTTQTLAFEASDVDAVSL
jgi:hypothetical protein